MKKNLIRAIVPAVLLAALMVSAGTAGAFLTTEAAAPERLVVPLSRPGQPATLDLNLMFGSIKSTGYEGKDVIVEATPRTKKAGEGSGPGTVWSVPKVSTRVGSFPFKSSGGPIALFGKDEQAEKDKQAKAAGLKPVPLAGSALTVEEENNVVSVEVESWRQAYDVSFQVPVNTSLKIEGANLEGVTVTGISGEIQIESAGGDVKLVNVVGPVVAESNNGDIEAVFTRVPSGKPMSFVTFNGDVDVTLPAESKATFQIKSSMGEVFTDFDLALKSVPVEPEKSTGREGGKYRVSLERAVLGNINGGGAEMTLQNFTGNIYIRKRK